LVHGLLEELLRCSSFSQVRYSYQDSEANIWQICPVS
jgi:hypothetical protein